MKKTLFLSLALACSTYATDLMLSGVANGNWYDVTKYNLRVSGETILGEDSLTCGSVTAANMLAYYQSQHEEGVTAATANANYDAIYEMQGNSEATAFQVLNDYCAQTYGATGTGITTSVSINNGTLTNKVEITPDGYGTTLYSNMTLQDAVQWGVTNNTAMGLTMVVLATGQSHAMTVWGAEFTTSASGTSSLTALYYTNSDDVNRTTDNPSGWELEKATVTTSSSSDGSIIYNLNKGGVAWKIVELSYLLNPYSMASKPEDTNPVTITDGSADFSVGGDQADATSFKFTSTGTLTIGTGKTMYSDRVSGSSVALNGTGTFVAESFSMGDTHLGTDWKGTLRLTGYYEGKTKADALTADTLNAYGNAQSVIEFKGAEAAYLNDTTAALTRDLKLTNSGSSKAFSLLAVSGNQTVKMQGSVGGSGDWYIQNDSGVSTTQNYTISGDAAGWTGAFISHLDAKGSVTVDFGTNSVVNASVTNEAAGSVSVSFAKNATINGDLKKTGTGSLTVTAADGDHFTGDLAVTRLNVNGKVNIGESAAALAANPGAESSTSTIGADELYFAAGSTLELDGNYSLSGQNITLADDYITQLQAANINTIDLIKAGTGSSISGVTDLISQGSTLNTQLEGTGYRILTGENGSLTLTNGTIDTLNLTLTGASVQSGTLYLQVNQANIDGVDLYNVGRINIYLSGSLIRNLFSDTVTPDTKVDLGFNGYWYEGLSNVTFYSDGGAGYSGEGDGYYLLGSVPEPATATLSLLALAGLCARRRR